MRRICLLILSLIVLSSCKKGSDVKLFTELSPDDTGINFKNLVRETEEFNVLIYGYFHQGGGVAIGDVNNDNLPDIYFTGNMMASKLFINKGNWEFEEVAEKAGLRAEGLWNTGTTMADVNGDGWLDIYVCRSAANDPDRRKNLLFINNRDLTFTEKAESYGLADRGYSTQASFFDYDRDGDLDMFSLNHSTQEFAGFSRVTGDFKNRKNALLGSKLFRNDGERFTDVTESAGIINNVLGFGLGVTVTDANNDHWPDIYISNDYNEEDYFYINGKDGTFKEALDEHFGHVSFFSMGADAADLNNDLRSDIITLDMLPEDSYNQKKILGPENYEKYRELLSKGFFPQSMRNMLHVNQGNGYFSEVGQLAGISNTDWSWSVLAADYDNDGWKDLMVTNGYMRNYLDMDFLTYMVGERLNLQQSNKNVVLLELINKMPPIAVRNYFYKNNGDLTFAKTSEEWGFEDNTVSNAAAYGDLDNDGDLDLIVCHTNAEASVFRNNSEVLTKNNFLKIKLRGNDKNTFGIGAKVILYHGGNKQQQEMIPVRGFQSSVNYELAFGLGKTNTLDSLFVIWPDSAVQALYGVQANKTLSIDQKDAKVLKVIQDPKSKVFSEDVATIGIKFTEAKGSVLDFKRDRMIPNSISTSGPKLIRGDINNDGLEDLFIAAFKGSENRLFKQLANGTFVTAPKNALPESKGFNDKDGVFLDADGDGDQDLYVVSGGNEYQENAAELQDRLYFNDGHGNFKHRSEALPEMISNGSSVTSGDFNRDGLTDLFVGGRSIPGRYPLAPRSYLLKNTGKGKFEDVTAEFCPALVNPGMVTDAQFADINNDDLIDLMVIGEWMEVGVYLNENGTKLALKEDALKEETSGWWLSIEANDFDRDGDMDFVLGNFGLNNVYHADAGHPASLLYKDFDNNGSIDPIFHYYIDDTLAFAYSRDELIGQIPSMKKKFISYESFASAPFPDYFSQEQLSDSDTLTAVLFETVYLQNDGKGNLELKILPVEAQFSPVFALASADINGDGHLDILTGGNFSQARVSVGQCDANYGIVFLGDGKGSFSTLDPATSGLLVRGDVRDIEVMKVSGENYMVVSRNGDTVKAYKIRNPKSEVVAATQ
ncbi:MAG: VCBS repeat-containing protein [Cyclobacteriaceae bacterium]